MHIKQKIHKEPINYNRWFLIAYFKWWFWFILLHMKKFKQVAHYKVA